MLIYIPNNPFSVMLRLTCSVVGEFTDGDKTWSSATVVLDP
jgi:hypothetical protein